MLTKTHLKMAKKTEKSKFLSKDINEIINQSQFMKTSPKPKRVPKRQQKTDEVEDDDISALIGEYQASIAKKQKVDKTGEHKDTRQKLLKVMEEQLNARKKASDNLLRNLSQVLAQLEADYTMLIENEQKLEHLVSSFLKCIQQASTASKQKLAALEEIHASFKLESEELETAHKADTAKLADELEEDMNKLQQKLVSETKRKQLDNLRKTIFNAMQNDF